jgi:regulator of protease activity HflC (stomatin/prohibitin superfamily)
MFPGELKKVFAQVVTARKEGLAALEKARGETAALRNLANAAKLVENNPALMQLRMIQSLEESSGNTLVVGLPGEPLVTPRPAKAGDFEEPGPA